MASWPFELLHPLSTNRWPFALTKLMAREQVKKPGLPATNAKFAESLGISADEWTRIGATLGRSPNELECQLFSILWGERYSYKSSAELTRGLSVYQGAESVTGGDDGLQRRFLPKVVSLGNGRAIAISFESCHLDFSFDPSTGCAAAVASAVSEIVNLSGNPLALFYVLHLGGPDTVRSQRDLQRAQAAVSRAANIEGLPLLATDLYFHPSREVRAVFDVGCVGVLSATGVNGIVKNGMVEGDVPPPGSLVAYFGLKTAFDGLPREQKVDQDNRKGGASVRPRVADLTLDSKLREVMFQGVRRELFSDFYLVNRGGIAAATFELQSRLGVGMRLDLNKIPTLYSGMTPRGLLLSQTPQRVLVVVPRAKHRQATDFIRDAGFGDFGLELVTIGETLDTEYTELCWNHKEVAVLPYEFMLEGFLERKYQFSKSPPMLVVEDEQQESGVKSKARLARSRDQAKGDEWSSLRTALQPGSGVASKRTQQIVVDNIEDCWIDLLASPNICSRRPIQVEADLTVSGSVLVRGEVGASVLRLRGPGSDYGFLEQGVAISLATVPLYVAFDPYMAGVQAMARAFRAISAAGAVPIGAGCSLTFGSADAPEVVGQLAEIARGLRVAAENWRIPIVEREVSLSPIGVVEDVVPTPAVTVVGLVANPARCCPASFSDQGDAVLVIGETRDELGCSEFAQFVYKKLSGDVPEIDFEVEHRTAELVRELAVEGIVKSASAIGAGGLAVALTECAVGREQQPTGVTLQLKAIPAHQQLTPEILLFAESASRYVVSCESGGAAELKERIRRWGVTVAAEGVVGGNSIAVAGFSIPVATAARIWRGGLGQLLGQYKLERREH